MKGCGIHFWSKDLEMVSEAQAFHEAVKITRKIERVVTEDDSKLIINFCKGGVIMDKEIMAAHSDDLTSPRSLQSCFYSFIYSFFSRFG